MPSPSTSPTSSPSGHQRRSRGLRAGQAPLLPNEVRHRIVTERADGRSLRAIATDLEDDDVPTARGGRWHASTVAHVLRSVAVDDALDDADDELVAA